MITCNVKWSNSEQIFRANAKHALILSDQARHGWSSNVIVCAMPGNRHWTFRRLATTALEQKAMAAKHLRHEYSRKHVEHVPPTSHSEGEKPASTFR
ncbi:hypothetical protein PoB_006512100 [Plakobranchus ocellatus]|uniref:Uncharacterized protein n=1 Tax=Plakobranchus ocellatus TaxID=259542 RepID=A0AAV4D3G2_9GAST|nr:hypothetical protein PoB_006512100 [Plakobranchus ocellatus]